MKIVPIFFLIVVSSALAVDAVPRNATEALTSYSWTIDKGDMTFLPDGRVDKSWREKIGWRWRAVSDRVFNLRLAGGSHKAVTLTFDEGFTQFQGPDFRGVGEIRGKRGAPITRKVVDQEKPSNPTSKEVLEPASSPSPSLTPAPEPTATPEAPKVEPSAGATKDTLSGIAENGPFITDQVFSALDMPSVSEATVALWKEDLLDEAAAAPAEMQPMYRQAAMLVDVWKSALRERYQIISTSQFSGAVMDAPDMASSRKTVLHVWDWLEYARERDAAAKHERKLQRTADFFASGPPRRWAERSAVLRAQVDRLYTSFRKLKRETSAPAGKP